MNFEFDLFELACSHLPMCMRVPDILLHREVHAGAHIEYALPYVEVPRRDAEEESEAHEFRP